MLTINPTVVRWIRSKKEAVKVGNIWMWTIPDGEFTSEEIEELRQHDLDHQRFNEAPLIANFLPDDIRPKGIPKM